MAGVWIKNRNLDTETDMHPGKVPHEDWSSALRSRETTRGPEGSLAEVLPSCLLREHSPATTIRGSQTSGLQSHETKQPSLFRLLLGYFVMASPLPDTHSDAAETQVHSSSFLCLNRSGSVSCKIPRLYKAPEDSD